MHILGHKWRKTKKANLNLDMLQRLWSGDWAKLTLQVKHFSRLRCSLPHLKFSCLGSKPQHRAGADPAVAGAQAPVSCVWLAVCSVSLALCWCRRCPAWSYQCGHPLVLWAAHCSSFVPGMQPIAGDLCCQSLVAKIPNRQLHASATTRVTHVKPWTLETALILLVVHETPLEMLNYKHVVRKHECYATAFAATCHHCKNLLNLKH